MNSRQNDNLTLSGIYLLLNVDKDQFLTSFVFLECFSLTKSSSWLSVGLAHRFAGGSGEMPISRSKYGISISSSDIWEESSPYPVAWRSGIVVGTICGNAKIL